MVTDEFSASAAEFFAAVQRGIIFGNRTMGTGGMATIIRSLRIRKEGRASPNRS